MDPTPELARQLDADRVKAARLMTLEQRLLAGPALFDLAVEAMRAGIRMQQPGVDEETIERIVVERLRQARRFEARA